MASECRSRSNSASAVLYPGHQVPAAQSFAACSRRAQLAFRLDNVPISRWHLRACLIMASATLLEGFDAMALAFAMPLLIDIWRLSLLDAGVLIGIGYLGQILGAWVFWRVAERHGRVLAASLAVLLMATMGVVCVLAPSASALMLSRFLHGVGVGGEVIVVAAYLREVLQGEGATLLRGRLRRSLRFSTGLVLGVLCGSLIVPWVGWQALFLLGGLPALLVTLCIMRLPESPRWLIAHGHLDEAESVLRTLEASTALRCLSVHHDGAAVQARLHGLSAAGAASSLSMGVSPRDVYPAGRWVGGLSRLSACMGIGVLLWLPTFYTTIYQLPLRDALVMASASTLLCCLATGLAARLAGGLHRRRYILASYLLSTSLLALPGLFQPADASQVLLVVSAASLGISVLLMRQRLASGEVPAVVLAAASRVPSASVNPVAPSAPWRASGLAMAVSGHRALAALAPLLVGALVSAHGLALVLLGMAGINLVALLVAARVIR